MRKLSLLAVFATVAVLPFELGAASSSSVRGSNHDSPPRSPPPSRPEPAPRPAPAPRPEPSPRPAPAPAPVQRPGNDKPSRPDQQRERPSVVYSPPIVFPDDSDNGDQPPGPQDAGVQNESTQPSMGLTPDMIAQMKAQNTKIEISEELQARARQEKKRVAAQKASFSQQEAQRIQENQMNSRRLDIDQERNEIYDWYNTHRGTRVDALPQGCRRFTLGKGDYFYIEGIFYQPGTTGGYVVVDPPTGAVVDELPPGAESQVINSPDGFIVYYYANGVFYEQVDSSDYRVIPAPAGVTVASIPTGASVTVVNGRPYYLFDGNFYAPVMENGVISYMTVQQPT